MEKKNTTSSNRPEAYPQPTETDTQLKGQSEFIDEEQDVDQEERNEERAEQSSKRGGDAANDTLGNP